MTTNHHTQLAYRGRLTSALMESPLAELDAAITRFNGLHAHGGVGDGTTDDTEAVEAAEAAGGAYLPVGESFLTTIGQASLTGPFWGRGQVIDSDGDKRAPWFSAISAAPSSEGTHGSVLTAFNGDLSHTQIAMEHRITGASTLGEPASDYKYTPEAYPVYIYLYNTSGHNEATDSPTGRTAACAIRTAVYQTGQGDAVAYNATAFVSGSRAGSTDFLANPAAVLFNGDMFAGSDGVYLNSYETSMTDQGYDVAALGPVINFSRTNETGAKNVWWQGVRVQSTGTKEIDVAFGARGLVNIGLDLSFVDFPTSGTYQYAAITLAAAQRIYLNATATDATGLMRFPSATGTTWIDYDSGTTAIRLVAGGTAALQVYSSLVAILGYLDVTGDYRVDGTKVVGNRDTGWTAMTGSPDKATSYATGSVTLAELAGRVASLQAALTTHGLIGA